MLEVLGLQDKPLRHKLLESLGSNIRRQGTSYLSHSAPVYASEAQRVTLLSLSLSLSLALSLPLSPSSLRGYIYIYTYIYIYIYVDKQICGAGALWGPAPHGVAVPFQVFVRLSMTGNKRGEVSSALNHKQKTSLGLDDMQ